MLYFIIDAKTAWVDLTSNLERFLETQIYALIVIFTTH